MPGEAGRYLYDIVHAPRLIRQFTNGKSLEDDLADPMLHSAVERQFEIIGEALNRACRVEPDLADRISSGRQIIVFLAACFTTMQPLPTFGPGGMEGVDRT
jgi:hypothetical protein